MKRIAAPLIITLTLITAFILIKYLQKNNITRYTIGVIQTASHPALDATRQGFIEELKKRLGDDISFIIQNAEGSIVNAQMIAQRFHANSSLDGFFTIATPATQAMHSVEKERPIIIAAVTDPALLGLTYNTTNVCGVSDMIDVQAAIDLAIQLMPQVRTIGLIYTAGESNSIALVSKMRSEIEKRGLKANDFVLGSQSEIATQLEVACRNADLLMAPTDNTVASSIALIAKITQNFKKPLIVSDNMLVASGALAARGVDYKSIGKQAATIAYKVLVQQKKPFEIPIEYAIENTTVINQKVQKELAIAISNDLAKRVVFIP